MPNLKPAKRILIRDIIKDKDFKNKKIIKTASYTNRTVKTINRNFRFFNNTIIPLNRGRRPRFITPIIFNSLLKYLGPKPNLYLEEIVEYFLREFRVCIIKISISKILRSISWLKKNIRYIIKE